MIWHAGICYNYELIGGIRASLLGRSRSTPTTVMIGVDATLAAWESTSPYCHKQALLLYPAQSKHRTVCQCIFSQTDFLCGGISDP